MVSSSARSIAMPSCPSRFICSIHRPWLYPAKLAEDRKFYDDKASTQQVMSKHGGDHVFVLEDGSTLGVHALAHCCWRF